jgi:hypothetical protein
VKALNYRFAGYVLYSVPITVVGGSLLSFVCLGSFLYSVKEKKAYGSFNAKCLIGTEGVCILCPLTYTFFSTMNIELMHINWFPAISLVNN